MKRIKIVLFLVLFSAVYSQEGNQEVGSYSRKSITYINALWLMDASVKGMPSNYVTRLKVNVQHALRMSRFDYNAIPQTYQRELIDAASAVDLMEGEQGMDQLATLMNQTIVARILKVLEAEKEMRAANLLTDQQKNSFITDKAKSLGVTDEELKIVMNAAYIYLPTASNFSAITSGEDYYLKMNVGVVWFKIDRTKDGFSVKPILKKTTSCSSKALVGRRYIGHGDHRSYAFEQLVEQAGKNLKIETQNISDFQLSGQVIEEDGTEVGFDIGSREGLKLDNKYLLFEKFEDDDGSIEEEEIGWLQVTDVAKAGSGSYISHGKMISGKADIGTELREFAQMNFELHFGLKQSFAATDTIEIDAVDLYSTSPMQGLDLNIMYNFGPGMGYNQLFFDFGIGYSAGSIELRTEEITAAQLDLQLGLMKRFYLGHKVAFNLKVGAAFHTYGFTTTPSGFSSEGVSYSQLLGGLYSGGAIEMALSPSFHVGVRGDYHVVPVVTDWLIDEIETVTNGGMDLNGLSVGLYFTYQPKSLSFSPWGWILGNLGV